MRVTCAPCATFVCHCRGCQRMTSSTFSLTAMFPDEGFEVIESEPVKGGAHSEGIDHYHCPHCKSWVFTRVAKLPHFVNVRATMFDEPDWCVPFVKTMTREKLPWVTTLAVYSYEGFPPPGEFIKLLQEYAATH
ncbi:MAG: GFA family protein [Breoghania sp.]|nr:GFA family protein [Breoghania sp.]MDJ0932284.1 GFA family protein [Breoghania sp.]